MTPHLPYSAEPKTTYYFRPYNHQHIANQQAIAQGWGAPASSPYSNGIFDSVYAEFEEKEPEQVEPTEPEVPTPAVEENELPQPPLNTLPLEFE